jgi:hypothetical protein
MCREVCCFDDKNYDIASVDLDVWIESARSRC